MNNERMEVPNLSVQTWVSDWAKRWFSLLDVNQYKPNQTLLTTFIVTGLPSVDDIRMIFRDKSAMQHLIIVLPKTTVRHNQKTKTQVIRYLENRFCQQDLSNKDISVDIVFTQTFEFFVSTNSKWKFLVQSLLKNFNRERRLKVYTLKYPQTYLDTESGADQHTINAQFFFSQAPERIYMEMKVGDTESGRFADN